MQCGRAFDFIVKATLFRGHHVDTFYCMLVKLDFLQLSFAAVSD